MNPGLLYLLRKRPVRAWRSLRRRFKGVRGVLTALAIAAFLLLVLGPQFVIGLSRNTDTDFGASVRTFGPAILLAFTVLSVVLSGRSQGALYFRPEEIDHLFPAPVTRRALLVYHVVSRLQVQVLSALWVSLFVGKYASSYFACVLGSFLALALLQLLIQATLLVAAVVGKRLALVGRVGAALALLGSLGAAAVLLRDEVVAAKGFWGVVAVLVDFAPVRVLAAAFVPVTRVFAAESVVDLIAWTGASLLVLGAVLFAMTRLDAAYEEVALDSSRAVQQRLRRMRSGAGAWGARGPRATRFSVPRFPRLEGAGAIAWRQAVAMLRNGRAIVGVALFLSLWPVIFGGMMIASLDREATRQSVLGLIPAVVIMGALATQNLPFDFRRDAERLDMLKALPLRAAAVAVGEIAPAALLVALLTGVVAGALGVVAGVMQVALVPLLCVAIVPFTWAVAALDNALFLVMPQRFEPDEAANLGFMGTTMFLTFVKMFALLTILTLGAAVGALVGIPTESLAGGVAAGAVTVCLADVALTWLVAWLFDRHDPSRHRPE